MKKLKKLIVAVLVICFCTACFAGCGGNKGGQNVDQNKTQLYVGNSNFGFGSAWLTALAARFENDYKDYSFEEGKTGAQIIIDNGSGYGGTTLLPTVDSLGQDVIFGESTYYYDFLNAGKMLDITDIVTEKLTGYNESRSISEKLLPDLNNYLKTADGKYYGLPNYECTYWITYNIDYFNDKGLYFSPEGTFVGKEGPLSKGPDGVEDTYDDGLPATFDDFFKLCQEIQEIGGTPIGWPGGIDSYRNVYLGHMMAGLEGKENFKINYGFNGTVTDLVKFKTVNGVNVPDIENGVANLETKEITTANAYEMYRQAGRYYAIKFFEEILENGYASTDATGSTNHTDTQSNFINSQFEGSQIAMHFDGNFWENEATSAFQAAETLYGEKATKKNSNFGVMPFPRATAADVGGRKNSYVVSANSLAFIYAGVPQNRLEIAKKFLQYAYTDASLIEYNQIVGTSRGCNVDFTEAQLEGMTEYAKNSLKYRRESDVLIDASPEKLYINNINSFSLYQGTWDAYVNDASYNDPIYFLRFSETGMAKAEDKAAKYFAGILGVYQEKWDGFSAYFN